MSRFGLVWRTVRHLTLRQAIYQVIHHLRSRAKLRLPKTSPLTYFLTVAAADKPVSWRNGEFTFLNQPVQFRDNIDWNYNLLGKLWAYHLNYFDFLNQSDMMLETGLRLIRDFIRQTPDLRTGLETYPTSLRIINWVHFLSRHRIQDKEINRHLFAQIALVNRRLEYHLSGNHLLENGFAILIGGLYLRHKQCISNACRLIRQELTKQILADGGHYERSPVYHQLLLDRLLDVLLSLQGEPYFSDAHFIAFLRNIAAQMLRWINAMTFGNGEVPMVNDAALDLAPTAAQLHQKAITVSLKWIGKPATLTESGYRMFRQFRYELVTNIGSVGPNHQPGHAHADTLSFVLYVDNCPIIVDTGISTYQPGSRREWERSTVAHNTVTIEDSNSSEVWAVFRVGRRARVRVLTDTSTRLIARHDGYRQLGWLHQRTWLIEPTRLVIKDTLLNAQTNNKLDISGVARFYFYPTIHLHTTGDTIWAGPLKICFQSATKPKITVIRSQVANGFNRLQSSYCLTVGFVTELETTLTFAE